MKRIKLLVMSCILGASLLSNISVLAQDNIKSVATIADILQYLIIDVGSTGESNHSYWQSDRTDYEHSKPFWEAVDNGRFGLNIFYQDGDKLY